MRLKHPREHDKKHLEFIRTLPCVCCGNDIETEAAHLRSGNLDYGKRHTGGSEKPSDKWTVPLCGKHHREQHSANEIQFWNNYGVDPWRLSLCLYASSGDSEMCITILERQGNHARSQFERTTQERC